MGLIADLFPEIRVLKRKLALEARCSAAQGDIINPQPTSNN